MTLNGIDVANYQAGIGKVASDFRIIKATEGTTYTNPELDNQINGAPELLGFYHFASNGDYKAEADFFLSKIGGYIGKAILVLDYEPGTPNPVWAKNWLDYVYARTGVRPLIYMSLSVENAYDWAAVVQANYGLWVAQYNNYNTVSGFAPRDLYGSLKHWKAAAMFQYTSAGRLTEWGDNLDFDVFYGDPDAWAKYAAVSGKVTASAPAAQPAGPQWVADAETYTLKTDVNLRTGASTNDNVITTLAAGTIVKTDQAIIQGGYRWVRQPREDGYGYLATGPEGNTLEYVTTGSVIRAIRQGETVTVTNPVDTAGNHLMVSGTYTVTQLDGTRAVISKGGVVVAAINTANLALA